MSNFGSGDYGGYNDFVYSGGNSFWTNWNTGLYSTGALGRITGSMSVRWGASGALGGSSTTGHHDVWDSAGTRRNNTNGISVGQTSDYGNWNTDTFVSDYWTSTASFYGGFWRTASQTSQFGFKDGTNNSYSGKSADDANNTGGTANWGGVGNPGGLAFSSNFTPTAVYVRRTGAWSPAFVYVRRSGAWSSAVVYVRRSGGWTPANYFREMNLRQTGIPTRGERVEVNLDGYWEPGYVVEAAPGWFGPVDPSGKFVGRYNTWEPEEVADARLFANERKLERFAAGDEEGAQYWSAWLDPQGLPTMRDFKPRAKAA